MNLLSVTTAAIIAGSLINSVPTFAQSTVKIGFALPLTGPTAGYGKDGRMGAELAAAEINAAGGILGGRKIELLFEDEKGTPQDGVAAVQKLMTQGGAKAIIAGMNSSITLAESAMTKNKILHVNPGAQADAITEQGSPYLFQINNTSTANSTVYHKYLINTKRPKTIVYMGENTEFNKAVLDNLKKSLDGTDTKLIEVANYDSTTTDFTSIITRLKAAKPDMIYVVDAYPARTAQIWKQIRQQGGFPMEAHSTGTVQASAIRPAEGAMEGVLTGDIFIAEGATGAMAEFIKRFKAKYGEDPNKVSLVSYEAVQVIAGAMNKAGSDSDYGLISKTIRTNTWETPRGSLNFDEKGRARAPYFYIHVVKGNDVALLDLFRVK
ncbi:MULTISPECIES: ABC transporter substrate-binding protein [unclassified Chelatococcus]|uniref:ABC transporter substrate-binding protein n=1 Tax=unclassified Chelatococcus TaxID=2638111 RepID=UPI001BCC3442|nr:MULTISPECIES: ABC transporter substrate-binding protein [unclassified Chelatococcus]MBS7701402.1 ABC transporter substrate-binding protein [Chelatococcus sp. YT9]MBX3557482.1 ABC transporter substrate-binding protein [Chelatococcus sp.]